MKRLIFALFISIEAHVLPIGLAVTGENVYRKTLVEIVESIPLHLPFPDEVHPQQYCADKGCRGYGYDYPDVRWVTRYFRYEDANKSREKEIQDVKLPASLIRRWIWEKIHRWMNRFRKILVRWEKQVDNYLAFFASCLRFVDLVTSQLFK